MEVLLLFAFISGLVTIFAPCIWPLLPIILSSTTTGGHRKPLGITLGIMLSFGFLTLTISYIVKIIPFDPNILRYLAVVIIGFLGLALIIPKLSGLLEAYVSRLSGKLNVGNRITSTDFHSGLITGLALGVIWTPCAGPILATIATLAATQAVNLNVILITFSYILGVGIPLFIFATAGSKLFTKSRFLTKYTGRIQQIFGVIMILTAISIATNYDKVLQAKLLDLFPSYSSFITKLENNSAVKTQLKLLKGSTGENAKNTNQDLSGLFNDNTPAPEFSGITKWLNTDKALSLKELRGKVVLVDFWTYTCINCIRTLPHVTSWYDKYKDQGFVVVGVHTPEFEFEKDTGNVEDAIKQYSIHYPVPQDNNFATWNAFSNQYWPAEYLIDAKGIIRRTHFGEGEYEETEKAIQVLLKEAGEQVIEKLENMPDMTPREKTSPETYLGAQRMQYLYPNFSVGIGKKNFSLTENIPINNFSFGGTWKINDDNAISVDNSVIEYNFSANYVYLVMSPSLTGTSRVRVILDGKLIPASVSGSDVSNGIVVLDRDRLYNLVNLRGKSGQHILRLEFENPGIKAFAFTFG